MRAASPAARVPYPSSMGCVLSSPSVRLWLWSLWGRLLLYILGQGPRLKEKWVFFTAPLQTIVQRYTYQLFLRISEVCWLWSDKILDSCFLQLYKRLCQMLCHVVFMVYYCDLITQVFCGGGSYFGSGLSG